MLTKHFVMGIVAILAITLTGCEPKVEMTAVEEAIARAEKMDEAELLAAAKAEIGDNKLVVYTQPSGTRKALAAFKEKYGIDYDTDAAGISMKDYQLYTALNVVANGKYYADMVMIQDARSLFQYMDEGLLYSYTPKDIELAKEDKYPQGSIYFNKLFVYNKENTDFEIENVWQLAGTADDPKHINKLSFQSPATENINMNFLLTLTSPAAVEKLKTAYKAYYGVDYVDTDAYYNIGYKYIKEFLDNISTYHTSDTTAYKDTLRNDDHEERTVFYGAFAKYKNLVEALGGDPARGEQVLGWQDDIVGFKGFLYKMYTVIPATAKYPLATALFVRYLLTAEGFAAGWANQPGYYSANPANAIADGDKPLSYWKQHCLIEDAEYLSTVKNSTVSFVQANL